VLAIPNEDVIVPLRWPFSSNSRSRHGDLFLIPPLCPFHRVRVSARVRGRVSGRVRVKVSG